jgi:hypothetical protein
MPGETGNSYDFFLSRRGSVAAVAREVEDVLSAKGYAVFTQDYDIPLSTSFIEAMHDAIRTSRDLVILFTRDYESSPYTRKEFTSFEAQRLQTRNHGASSFCGARTRRCLVCFPTMSIRTWLALATQRSAGGGSSQQRKAIRKRLNRHPGPS